MLGKQVTLQDFCDTLSINWLKTLMVETMEPASERIPVSNEQTRQVAEFQEYLERNPLPKRNRVNIWSKTDMLQKLRLYSVMKYTPIPSQQLYCVLCMVNSFTKRECNYSCSICNITLCIKLFPGVQKTCFEAWHTMKDLKREHRKRKQLLETKYASRKDATSN